jgi:hypothetical protein
VVATGSYSGTLHGNRDDVAAMVGVLQDHTGSDGGALQGQRRHLGLHSLQSANAPEVVPSAGRDRSRVVRRCQNQGQPSLRLWHERGWEGGCLSAQGKNLALNTKLL